MSPDDSQTAAEARVVHPLYEARLARLAAMRNAMPTGVSADLNDETLLAIAAGIQRVKRGSR